MNDHVGMAVNIWILFSIIKKKKKKWCNGIETQMANINEETVRYCLSDIFSECLVFLPEINVNETFSMSAVAIFIVLPRKRDIKRLWSYFSSKKRQKIQLWLSIVPKAKFWMKLQLQSESAGHRLTGYTLSPLGVLSSAGETWIGYDRIGCELRFDVHGQLIRVGKGCDPGGALLKLHKKVIM